MPLGSEDDQSGSPGLLAIPDAQHVEYPRNLIRQAICEIRFPTLLELDAELPIAFNKALRKEFPNYERGSNLVVVGAEAQQQASHSFKSRDSRWILAIRSSAIALETRRYATFEEFHGRLMLVLKLVGDLLDTDFYTRVGLRYINALPIDEGGLAAWTNPALTALLNSGVLGEPDVFWQDIRGQMASGAYSMRHGFEPGLDATKKRDYILDFDLFKETVEASEFSGLVHALHQQGYRLFDWMVGPKAKEYMKREK